jgi:prephenate dehydrogenase
VQWRKVVLAGVGLLGGSLGLALRERALAAHVTGLVRRRQSIQECLKLGIAHTVTRNVAQAVEDADLIVLCTPLSQMEPLFSQMLPFVLRGTIVTDVGSVKRPVVVSLERVGRKKGIKFVGSHPMAGGEKMGAANARADLFENALCIVTPTATSDQSAVRKIEKLWKNVGSRVLNVSPVEHDRLVSGTSHLPHVLAAALSRHVLKPQSFAKSGPFCANGFRDTTRIASGSPEMWRDIALANRQHLLASLDGFAHELTGFVKSLKAADSAKLLEFFASAKNRRDDWVTNCPSSSAE